MTTYNKGELLKLYSQTKINDIQLENEPTDWLSILGVYNGIFSVPSLEPVNKQDNKILNIANIEDCMVMSKNMFASASPNSKNPKRFYNSKKPSNNKIEQIKSSTVCLQQKYKIMDIQKKYWYYLDNYHHIQGPFSSLDIDIWYMKGYLQPNLQISFQSKCLDNFFAFKELQNYSVYGCSNNNNKNQKQQKQEPGSPKDSTNESVKDVESNQSTAKKGGVYENELLEAEFQPLLKEVKKTNKWRRNSHRGVFFYGAGNSQQQQQDIAMATSKVPQFTLQDPSISKQSSKQEGENQQSMDLLGNQEVNVEPADFKK